MTTTAQRDGQEEERLTVGSLFSGIGGLDLGLERAGMEVRWQCEIHPYGSRVLAQHWPDVPNLGDVSSVDWSAVERVDVVAGGFQCQDVSGAGLGMGLTDDTRSGITWRENVRAIRALRPRYVLVENVPRLLSGGDGAWFGRVLGDLAESGYDAEWDCIPAAAVGAPHLRDRIFIVAYPAELFGDGSDHHGRRGGEVARAVPESGNGGRQEDVAHPHRQRSAAGSEGGLRQRSLHDQHGFHPRASAGRDEFKPRVGGGGSHVADPERRGLQGRVLGRAEPPAVFPSSLRRAGRGHPLGRTWDTEPDVGRLAHGIPRNVVEASLYGLGNAVVPQVAELIGGWIVAHHAQLSRAA